MADAHQHTVVVSSMEGVDGAGMPKQPRASRPVVLAVYAAMALTGGVGLAQVGKTRTAASPTSSQASASLAEMAGEWEEMSEYQYGNSNCSEYDDDSIYTSDVCGDFDAGACANYCKGGDWCSYFCTNATTSSTEFGCDSGSGAICALQTLANIEKTCRVVESMNYTSKPDTWGTSHAAAEDGTLPGTPARSRPDRRLDEDIGKIAHNSSDVDNEGCDEHVFCEYCDDECNKIMNRKAIRLWGKAKYEYWYKTTGVGPMSMELLDDIVDMCLMIYPDGVGNDDDASDAGTDTTSVTTEHAHDESCGKGCTETVYDDDTTTSTVTAPPVVGSGNGDGRMESTESPEPMDATTDDTAAPLVGDSAGTEVGQSAPDGTKVVKVGSGQGDGYEKNGVISDDAAVGEDDATGSGHQAVVTEHAHDESCGKGCTETVYDDDTAYTASPNQIAAPKDQEADSADSETEETEEEEREEHTDSAGHPVVSSPNWSTGKTETASPKDASADSETEETEEEEREEHTDSAGHPVVSSPNWSTGKATTETASPMDATTDDTAAPLVGDSAGTEVGQSAPDGTKVVKVGSGQGDGYEKNGVISDDAAVGEDDATGSGHQAVVTEHAHDESCGKGCTETVYDDDTAYTAVVSDHKAAATSMAAADVTGEAGGDTATLAVVGAAFALVVAGVVAMRRRGQPAAYEPI